VTHSLRISTLAVAIAAGWTLPAQAQAQDSGNAAIRQELAAMRAHMQQMAARIDSLEGQLAVANAKAEAATTAAGAATAAAAKIPAPTATAKPATEITWDGAPRLASHDGWSFKPRGRLQVDVGSVSAPALPTAAQQRELGFATRLRRAFIGVEGTVPGGFGYRFETDLANSSVVLTDMFVTYKPKPQITLTLGHQKPFWGVEEQASDLFTSFQERASYSQAFGFERRVGFSAAYQGKGFLVQVGVFGDDVAALAANDADNSYSLDGRVVFMPKLGDGQLHLAGSIHYRSLKDQVLAEPLRYRARPFVRTTDLRFVDTGNLTGASAERGLGLEGAYVSGRFHATAESFWQQVTRTGFADPTFNGGYGEVGYLLTDDVTAYRGGVYDRIRPKHPLGKGGIGAIQINARYDWLDLNDAGIVGGRQQMAGVSMIWIPTDYVRFIADYGHLWISDSRVIAGGSPTYGADSFGLRAQLDF
jgi:phosphate-selective porin OprO/OprP